MIVLSHKHGESMQYISLFNSNSYIAGWQFAQYGSSYYSTVIQSQFLDNQHRMFIFTLFMI